MPGDVDVNKIANIIADIQNNQSKLETAEEDLAKFERQAEDEREYIQDVRSDIQSLRDELDAYLDEVIPERERAEPKYGSW